MSEAQPHVLVIDDDKRLRDLIGRYLSEQGYRVTTAIHAADARAKLASITFDLLVVDHYELSKLLDMVVIDEHNIFLNITVACLDSARRPGVRRSGFLLRGPHPILGCTRGRKRDRNRWVMTIEVVLRTVVS